MKRRQTRFALLSIVLFVAMSSLTGTAVKAGDNAFRIYSVSKNGDEDKKPSKKEKSLRNQNVVKVYHDILKKKVHVIAKSGIQKDIEFLVFDINGNMVVNYKMKSGEKRTIGDLKRGSYMYHVFSNDEYLTTGKIIFK